MASAGVILWALAVVPPAILPATAILGWFLLAIGAIDARHLIVPDVLVYPLLAGGLATSFVMFHGAWPTHVAGALLGAAFFAVIRWLFHHARGVEGLGWGDVKLFGAAGAWLGVQGLPNTLLIASLAALAFAVWRDKRLDFNRAVPFGTFLCLGIWLTWLYGPIDLIPQYIPGVIQR